MIPLYPKAEERLVKLSEPGLRKSRFALLRTSAFFGICLTVLFLVLFSYILGSLYQLGGHLHNLNVAFVDYDGGVVGEAVRQAYEGLRADTFFTLTEKSSAQFSQPGDLRSSVCDIEYWGAIYIAPGASDRLAAALSDADAASSYNTSDVLTWVWNQARYPTTIDSLNQQVRTLSEAARVVYVQLNGTGAVQSLDRSSPAAISAYSNPWELASVNIQPTSQGSRLIYNTLVIILLMNQGFFFLGTVNGLYAQFKLFGRVKPLRMILFRFAISGLYTLAGSMCAIGAVWAFRAGWDVNGYQWVLSWLTLWLFAHCNFLTLDVVAVWIPAPYVPMALITWVVTNVASTLIPFELSPGFFKWGFALPAHSVYNILIHIWSGGCNPQLNYALPVLFTYEIVSGVISGIGVYRRAHFAVIAAEQEEKSWHEKVANAVASCASRETLLEKTENNEGGMAPVDGDYEARVASSGKGRMPDREELTGRLCAATTQMTLDKARERPRESMGMTFSLR